MSGSKEAKYLTRTTAEGRELRLPVGIIHGARAGEQITVYGGQHGTEYAGIEAVQRLYRELDPADVRGVLVISLATNEDSLLKLERDRTFLLLAVQTGLRVSELLSLRCHDVVLGTDAEAGAHVRCTGKGRKNRCTPLRKDSVAALRAWLRECDGDPDDPLFPSTCRGPLGRDGVEYLLRKHVATARTRCPSLRQKRVTAHVLRHSAAMEWLHDGVDHAVIALLLGHESAETTDIYLHASMQLKEQAIAKTKAKDLRSRRYKPGDDLLTFLKNL